VSYHIRRFKYHYACRPGVPKTPTATLRMPSLDLGNKLPLVPAYLRIYNYSYYLFILEPKYNLDLLLKNNDPHLIHLLIPVYVFKPQQVPY
jgi:hypothetical protein